MDKDEVAWRGRQFLMDFLMRARFGVRAYEGFESMIDIFTDDDPEGTARPIRTVKPYYYPDRGWALDSSFDRPDILLAFVWYIKNPKNTRVKAMSYAEAFDIAYSLGYTDTKFFLEKGIWISANPVDELRERLQTFTASPAALRQKISGAELDRTALKLPSRRSYK